MPVQEQAKAAIEKYMDLLRIQKAADRDKELGNQLRETRAVLEALGIVTENLTVD